MCGFCVGFAICAVIFLHFLQKYRCVPKIGFSADIFIDISIDILIGICVDVLIDKEEGRGVKEGRKEGRKE